MTYGYESKSATHYTTAPHKSKLCSQNYVDYSILCILSLTGVNFRFPTNLSQIGMIYRSML